MNVMVALLIPGFLGGALFAALLALLNRRPSSGVVRTSTLEPISPDVINMAHIRVAGVGGLSMMGAGIVIAVYVPEIGVSLLTALVMGTALAIALIKYRSRSAAQDHDGESTRPPGVLALEQEPRRVRRPADDRMRGQRTAIA